MHGINTFRKNLSRARLRITITTITTLNSGCVNSLAYIYICNTAYSHTLGRDLAPNFVERDYSDANGLAGRRAFGLGGEHHELERSDGRFCDTSGSMQDAGRRGKDQPQHRDATRTHRERTQERHVAAARTRETASTHQNGNPKRLHRGDSFKFKFKLPMPRRSMNPYQCRCRCPSRRCRCRSCNCQP